VTQFKIYFGIIEENEDKQHLGRCQIRIIGLHSQNSEQSENDGIKKEHLPWCMPIFPLSSSNTGIGMFSVPVKGSLVACFPLDTELQRWAYFGTIPGFPRQEGEGNSFEDPTKEYPLKDRINEPDINRLARNDKVNNTIIGIENRELITKIPISSLDIPGNDISNFTKPIENKSTIDQISSEYAVEYPKNKVFESEPGLYKSGHILEFDDSTKSRIHLSHKTGSFFMIQSNGQWITRSISDNYTFILENDYSYVNKDSISTIWGDNRVLIRSNNQTEIYGYNRQYVKGNNVQYISGDFGLWIGSDLVANPDKPKYAIESKKRDGSIKTIEEKTVPQIAEIGGNFNLKVENNLHQDIKGNEYTTIEGTCYIEVTGTRNYTKNKVGENGDMTIETVGEFLVKGHKMSRIKGNSMILDKGCVNGFSICPYMLMPHSFASRSVKSSL
jgi:hypothetical protein